MSAEITLKFETPSELETWLKILKKYGLAEKIEIKTRKQKIAKVKPSRVWSLVGSGNSNGAINNNPFFKPYRFRRLLFFLKIINQQIVNKVQRTSTLVENYF